MLSSCLLLRLPAYTLHAGVDRGFFTSTRTLSKLPLATGSGMERRRGKRVRSSAFYCQSLADALGSSHYKPIFSPSPPTQGPRGGARAHWVSVAACLPGRNSEGGGAGLFPLGPRPFGPASPLRLRAPVRSPSWNWEEEGEGGRDERGAVVRREAETEKTGERARGASASP